METKRNDEDENVNFSRNITLENVQYNAATALLLLTKFCFVFFSKFDGLPGCVARKVGVSNATTKYDKIYIFRLFQYF